MAVNGWPASPASNRPGTGAAADRPRAIASGATPGTGGRQLQVVGVGETVGRGLDRAPGPDLLQQAAAPVVVDADDGPVADRRLEQPGLGREVVVHRAV